MKWRWVNVQVKQGKRAAKACVIESRIQIFDCCKVSMFFFSELIALMKFSVLETASFAVWVNLTFFLMTVSLNSLLFKTEYGRNVLVKIIQCQCFHYDCRSISIVLQPSPFFPKLYLIFQFLIIKNGMNKKSVGKLVKRWTYWWSS